MARTACLVCLVSTVNGCSMKKKEISLEWGGASSGHITNLKQSISFVLISMGCSLVGQKCCYARVS